MRAIVVRSFGGPEVLRPELVPVPVPAPGELLVEVVAAGVNPVDAGNCADGSWAGISLPFVPGSDSSGVVRAAGPGVRGFAVGDAVFAMTDFIGTRNGSYAEFQAIPAALAAPKPRGLSHAEAAAMPLAAGTAFDAIERLAVQSGETVVIFGAAGGVGGFATQLAAGRGARVVATGRARAHDYLREIGADVTIDHTSGDPVAQIAAAVGKVDALLDLAGGNVIPRGLPLIRSRGRAASIAALAGDLDLAIDQNLTVHGVLVRPDGARLRTLARLAGNGALQVRVRSEYPLDQAAAAHREMARGGIPGKTVLRARPEPAAGSDENR